MKPSDETPNDDAPHDSSTQDDTSQNEAPDTEGGTQEEVIKLDRNRARFRRPDVESPPPAKDEGNVWKSKSPKKKQPQVDSNAGDQSEAAYIRAKRAQQGSRQTVSYLSKRLASAGLRPVSKYGQNFLVDLNLIELIARSADIQKNDVILEIGTGVGSLTAIMAEQAGAILTVEIDQNLYQLAREELIDYPHVKMIQGDALRNKNSLRSDIMESIRDAKARLPDSGRFMLVANLPYNVATPIVSNLLHETPPPDRIVVTIQKELAERMIAGPGSKDYGALSVWVQSVCNAEIVRVLSSGVFWPRPKVESAIIRLDIDHERRNAIPDLKYFHQTVRSLFFHRRKFLRSVVISAYKGRLEKSTVDDVLSSLGHGENARAEELNLEQIGTLVETLRQAEFQAAQ
ncbi:16S rRNA (adenine(1518)-N(6)/adenine(1519)-N(6))-dimethyltransferase RsmA [Aporhodopirellula aestuarii]|uniref:Ribosomal RNA small subunit methyltransferase A n=1 Tax=Aporhodopirellula aestuarii TaxID=2950107 RepID=A0ABT0U4R5_9BACT|nr:16S rRNA (adenine(1518)-N(6)/adenine(1519)-N(6))-dimethyltransferase RsmA [Aporhodopirellula aestuarii]MCM2371929.1 16S rRNA (adenine(1518)-N(6)/adenine(1519)-N(6))-dimethyltransferase RsmA [Aporhodopirellula aestuarii]